jgi:hypothetical protein
MVLGIQEVDGVNYVLVSVLDFLLIVLKDLLPRRPELRLVLMSATLNAEMFSSYFGGAPMIHIPVRIFLGFLHWYICYGINLCSSSHYFIEINLYVHGIAVCLIYLTTFRFGFLTAIDSYF